MAKLYTSKKLAVKQNLKPSKETISFILNYSKVLSVHKIGDLKFELIAN